MPYTESRIITIFDKPLWWDDALYSRVRIELDLRNLNRPLQRHIWVKKDGGERVEDWILSIAPTRSEMIRAGYQ